MLLPQHRLAGLLISGPHAELIPSSGEDGIMLDGFWHQNGFRIDLRGSGGPSYIRVGPRGSDFRVPGALQPKFKPQITPKLIYVKIQKIDSVSFFTPLGGQDCIRL